MADLAANMYDQVAPETNFKALVDLGGINSITDANNGILASVEEATKRARFIEWFYDKTLLDTIRQGSENNVFLKYCTAREVPKGNSKLLLRRWGGLTEHTVPLAEGQIPKSDRVSSESFTGTFCQYGRYMEFSDRVEFNLIDDIIARYTIEMGTLAVRSAERLCRQEMMFFSGETYANNEASIKHLTLGDKVGINDYRLQALKFRRLQVNPINGCYTIICSPEHIYDLVSDPLVLKYMEVTNTATPFVTGKPMELFGLKFEETMMDDYAYGYTEISNPGEYLETVSGADAYALRLMAVTNGEITPITGKTLPSGTELYLNYIDDGTMRVVHNDAGSYLKDGSYIPDLVRWDTTSILSNITGTLVAEPDTEVAGKLYITYKDTDGVIQNLTGALTTTGDTDLASQAWTQLPVHRSFMFGKDHMIKTGISGQSGAKFFVKEAGSAGVLDPINQRQSIGYKINTLGFTCVRPEALVQFIFVPEQAYATAVLVADDYDKHYDDDNVLNNLTGKDKTVYTYVKTAVR